LKNGFLESGEYYLKQLESQVEKHEKNHSHDLDRIMSKWLAAFMDEGLAEWEMPNKNLGFYNAWRRLAQYDSNLDKKRLSEIPKTSEDAVYEIMKDYNEADYTKIFTYHLAALPGWTGYILIIEVTLILLGNKNILLLY
jgi:uncharacterized protein YbcC (UPF0753/DUF2309 family)